jgi:hypothetical protein
VWVLPWSSQTVEGVKLPPKRGGIDYKESHAREAEEVRR